MVIITETCMAVFSSNSKFTPSSNDADVVEHAFKQIISESVHYCRNKCTFPVYHEIKLWLWYFVSDLSKKVYGIRKRSLLKKPLETRRSNTIKKITGDTKCLSDLSSLLCPFNSQGNIRRLGHQINSSTAGLPWPFVPPSHRLPAITTYIGMH